MKPEKGQFGAPSKFETFVRSIVPSTAVLSRWPGFTAFLSVAEVIPRSFIRFFTKAPVPPTKYIVRIGVGNFFWRPHYWYLTSSFGMWMYYLSNGYVRLDSTIVDIGSGSGRSAAGLRDCEYHGVGFTGHYFGFDVDKDMVAWCSKNFPADRFTFKAVESRNKVYSPDAKEEMPSLDIGEQIGNADLVFSQSLFTHLLEQDLKHYIAESFRVLKPGGVMAMTFFCLEDLKDQGLIGGRWTFRHRMGAAYVENEDFPEAAVAYERDWILSACKEAGFSEVSTPLPSFQTTLIAVK